MLIYVFFFFLFHDLRDEVMTRRGGVVSRRGYLLGSTGRVLGSVGLGVRAEKRFPTCVCVAAKALDGDSGF